MTKFGGALVHVSPKMHNVSAPVPAAGACSVPGGALIECAPANPKADKACVTAAVARPEGAIATQFASAESRVTLSQCSWPPSTRPSPPAKELKHRSPCGRCAPRRGCACCSALLQTLLTSQPSCSRWTRTVLKGSIHSWVDPKIRKLTQQFD